MICGVKIEYLSYKNIENISLTNMATMVTIQGTEKSFPLVCLFYHSIYNFDK